VNRITKIIVGIALAMRFVHSRGLIHRDLKPENILLDWDWTVRIADFGHSIWSNESRHYSLIARDMEFKCPSIDPYYLAPECYQHGRHLQASDVFSFGLILYELLAGRPAFPNGLTHNQVAFKIAVENERPDIPGFVLRSGRELITECWAKEPGHRPTFDEIVDRLVSVNFKLIRNVNSSKIVQFFERIEKKEIEIDIAGESAQ
jgi:serine/threonine protein kinase